MYAYKTDKVWMRDSAAVHEIGSSHGQAGSGTWGLFFQLSTLELGIRGGLFLG